MRATQEDEEGVQWEQRGGWTMAAMLIWHKTRELRKQQSVQHTQASADVAGAGTVVFDVETTELIERDVPLQQMEVSVGGMSIQSRIVDPYAWDGFGKHNFQSCGPGPIVGEVKTLRSTSSDSDDS